MKTYRIAIAFPYRDSQAEWNEALDCLTAAVDWLDRNGRRQHMVEAFTDHTDDEATAVIVLSDPDTAVMLRLAL